jgi:hypothetical protein
MGDADPVHQLRMRRALRITEGALGLTPGCEIVVWPSALWYQAPRAACVQLEAEAPL